MTNSTTATLSLEEQLEELRRHNALLESQVRQRTFELQVLYDLSHQIGYTLNYDDLFRLMLQHLHRVVPYAVAGSILLLEGGPCELVIQYTRPIQPSLMEEIRRRMLTTLARISGKKTTNVQVYLRTYEVFRTSALQTPLSAVESVFQVPLIVGPEREVVGLLFVGAEQPHVFQEEHVRILYTVANQTATAIQQVRALLESEEQRLENLVAALPEGVILLDEHRRIVLANPAGQNYLALLARTVTVGDVLTHLAQQSVEALLQPVPTRNHELTFEDGNGTVLTFEVSTQPMTAGPQAGGWTVVIRDVTGRKRAEEEIRSLNTILEHRVEERTRQLEAANRELMKEIAAHKQTEETLFQERNLLKSIMDTSPVGILVADREGNIVFANSYLARILGVPVETILKRRFDDPVWRWSDFQDNPIADEQSVFRQVVREGIMVRDVQQATRCPSGEKILLSINGAPILDEQGGVERVVFTVRDVTKRVRTEEALRLSEAKLRMILTQIPSMLWVTDTSFIVTDMLGSELTQMGYDPNAFIGKPVDVLPGGDHQPAIARGAHERAIFQGLPSGYETHFHHRQFQVRIEPLRDKEHQVIGCIGLAVDITERKRAEEEVRSLNADLEQRVIERTAQLEAINASLQTEISERKRAEEEIRRMQMFLSSILENIPDVIFVKDATTFRFLLFNRAAEEHMMLPRSAMIGKTIQEIYPDEEEYAQICLSRDSQVVRDRVVLEIPDEVVALAESPRIYHTRLIPVKDEKDTVRYILGISADITERKKAEAELQRAWHAARAATQAKSDFLANMSHEIRTPLNAVLGMTRLLLDAELSLEQRDYVETILVSGELLLAIINDVLDLSKIEAGKMEVSYTPFDIHDCLKKSLQLVAVRAAENRNHLSYYIADDIPQWIMGDYARLLQILINLLSNAVKFTENGKIELLARRLESSNGNADNSLSPQFMMHITVSDTGIGIPEDRMDRLFKSFSQVDTSPSRKYGGTGLGLVISKNLAELMGGTMWAESVLGKGSKFHFTIRTEPGLPLVAQPVGDQLSRPDLGKKLGEQFPLHILLAEDNIFNQKVALKFLENLGYRADVAENGIEVMKALQERFYEVILMDVQMPNMDGMETVRYIRKHFPPDQQPWIIAMTAHALQEDRQRCLEAGMDDYVSKPIQLEELAKVLRKAWNQFRGKELSA